MSNKIIHFILLTHKGHPLYNIRMGLENQINFRVDDGLLTEIKQLAKDRHSTPSQVVRQAIAEYLASLRDGSPRDTGDS